MRFPALLALAAVSASVIVVACANGDNETTTTDDGTQPAPTSTGTGTTDPSGPVLPPPGSSSGSSGTSGSSGGDDSGTSSGDAATAMDSGADAAKDAAVEAAVDAGTTCVTVAPSNACGLAPQCGCAANATCDVTNGSTGAVSCVLAGGGPEGSYCTSTTQCAKGLMCGYNACRPYCATAGTNCTGAGLGPCAQYYDPSAGTPVTNAKVCSVICDPLNPTAVCASNSCIFDDTVNSPDCDKAGTIAKYGDCSKYNDCKPGLACINDPVYGLNCEAWCRIGGSDCAVFEDCVDVFGAVAPKSGGVRLGICQ